MSPEGQLRSHFTRGADYLEAALRIVLARPIQLEPGRRLQFEVCPYYYGVVLTDAEEEILPDGWLEPPVFLLELIGSQGERDPLSC